MTHIDVCVNNEVRQAHTLFSDYGLSDRKDGRRDFVVPLEDRLEVGDLISVRLCGSDLQGSPVVLEPSLRPLERAAIRLHIEKPDMPIATRLVTVKGWLTLHGGANAIAFLVDGKPQTAFFSVRPDVCEHFDTPFAVGWEIICDVSTIVASDASEMRLTCVIDDFEIAEQRLAVAPIPAQPKPSPLLLLMHVPKTAGTSLVAAISEHTDITTHWLYHRGRSSIVDQVAALSPQAFYDLDLVGGHFFFGLHHAIDRPCRYVSVLREPLDYLRSYFAYRKVVQHFRPSAILISSARSS